MSHICMNTTVRHTVLECSLMQLSSKAHGHPSWRRVTVCSAVKASRFTLFEARAGGMAT